MNYCDISMCEAEATQTVATSEEKAHDSTMNLCDACYEIYMIGVQHGRFHEAALHGTVPGRDSSQDPTQLKKPKR